MIRIGSFVYCIDNSGVVMVKIFQVIGNRVKREATLGSKVLVVVKRINLKSKALKDARKKNKFRRGSVHRAVIVNVKQKYRRKDRTWIWFQKNTVVMVDKGFTPYGRRVKLPVPREIADEYPSIGSICYYII